MVMMVNNNDDYYDDIDGTCAVNIWFDRCNSRG
jgi:hypothetical protein